MELDQRSGKSKVTVKYNYIVQRSKTRMKRCSWKWMETFQNIDQAFDYLRRVQIYRELEPNYFERYKYRISHRKITEEITTVCPKEIMVAKIKHGI